LLGDPDLPPDGTDRHASLDLLYALHLNASVSNLPTDLTDNGLVPGPLTVWDLAATNLSWEGGQVS